MKKEDDKKLEEIAAKINDGELDLSVTEQFNSHDAEKIAQALKKINSVSQIIRQQSEVKSIKPKQKWAHLKLKEKIGQGGIGEVYRAYDSVLNCDVAVKFLNKNSQLYISTEQFLQEARNMAKVRHPHVLAIHGATVDDDIAGYWSDYLDGITLNATLEHGQLSWQQQFTIAKQLSQALRQIHKNKLVHGDIKPQNVMIQAHRGAILLDFGSSRKQSLKNQNKILHASPMAMAPEQFAGELPSKSSDIFSLGLLLWNMTTGSHPFDGKDLEEIQQQTQDLQDKKQQLRGNKDWRQLILSMVAANPKQRPTIHQVMQRLDEIEQKPIKRAKKIAYAAVLSLALGVSAISLYSNYKTSQANAQTQAINTVLTDILLKSSPLDKGKDVLLVDVLADAQKALINNKDISDQQKTTNLIQLLQTYQAHSKIDLTEQLASQLLQDFDLNDSQKMVVLKEKAVALNEKNEFNASEPLFLQALSIKPISKQDKDVHVLALIGLIKNRIETFRFEDIPQLLIQAREFWKTGERKLSNMGLINEIEGNYFKTTHEYQKSRQSYLKAVKNFEDFYGKENLSTLNARSNAATVLLYIKEKQDQGIEELQQTLQQMVDFLGQEHSATLIARVNLASFLSDLQQTDKAIETIVPFMPYVYKMYGKENDKTLKFENIVAEVYRKAGKLDKADEIYQKIFAINTNKHTKESPITIRSRYMRVIFLQRTKQYHKAQTELSSLYPQALIALPEKNHLLLEIQELSIYNQYKLGDASTFEKMQKLKQKVIGIFGEKDPSVRRIVLRLGVMEKK